MPINRRSTFLNGHIMIGPVDDGPTMGALQWVPTSQALPYEFIYQFKLRSYKIPKIHKKKEKEKEKRSVRSKKRSGNIRVLPRGIERRRSPLCPPFSPASVLILTLHAHSTPLSPYFSLCNFLQFFQFLHVNFSIYTIRFQISSAKYRNGIGFVESSNR